MIQHYQQLHQDHLTAGVCMCVCVCAHILPPQWVVSRWQWPHDVRIETKVLANVTIHERLGQTDSQDSSGEMGMGSFIVKQQQQQQQQQRQPLQHRHTLCFTISIISTSTWGQFLPVILFSLPEAWGWTRRHKNKHLPHNSTDTKQTSSTCPNQMHFLSTHDISKLFSPSYKYLNTIPSYFSKQRPFMCPLCVYVCSYYGMLKKFSNLIFFKDNLKKWNKQL